MAVEYKHKEYFKRNPGYSTDSFTDVENAKTRCAFHSTWLTNSSPTITYALEDSNKTLVATLEFADSAKQEAWKTAVTSLFDGGTEWVADGIKLFKIEWLHADGSVSATTNLE